MHASLDTIVGDAMASCVILAEYSISSYCNDTDLKWMNIGSDETKNTNRWCKYCFLALAMIIWLTSPSQGVCYSKTTLPPRPSPSRDSLTPDSRYHDPQNTSSTLLPSRPSTSCKFLTSDLPPNAHPRTSSGMSIINPPFHHLRSTSSSSDLKVGINRTPPPPPIAPHVTKCSPSPASPCSYPVLTSKFKSR